MGLAWSKDPESYAGGSVATGTTSHARQVKGDDPEEKGYAGPPCCGSGVRRMTSPRKNVFVQNTSKTPWMGLLNRRRSGYKEEDFIFGTRKV